MRKALNKWLAGLGTLTLVMQGQVVSAVSDLRNKADTTRVDEVLATDGESGTLINQTETPASPVPIQTPKCFELDELQEEKYEKIDLEKSFFDEAEFDCENDFLEAETDLAIRLKSLGEESFRKYTDLGDDRAPAIRLRRLSRLNNGGYELVRIDCPFVRNKSSYQIYDRWRTGKGKVLVDAKNGYAADFAGKWGLRLTAADCALIGELFETNEISLLDIEPDMVLDPEGAIILHANQVFFEGVDSNGYYAMYDRYTGLSFLKDPDQQRTEQMLNLIFRYFEQRTRESGRRISRR